MRNQLRLLPFAVILTLNILTGCTGPSAPTSTGTADNPNLSVSENPAAQVSPSPMVPVPNASNEPAPNTGQAASNKSTDQRNVDQMRGKQIASPTP